MTRTSEEHPNVTIDLDNRRQVRSIVYMIFFALAAFDWAMVVGPGMFLALMDLVEAAE